MNSVNQVEISIINIGNNLSILLDVKNSSIKINGIEKTISNEKIDNFFRIIRLWKNEYNSAGGIDLEKFIIKIITDTSYEIMTGVGEYPDNYYELKKWIGDLYE